MSILSPVLAFSLFSLSAGSWIDIICVAIIVFCISIDAIRGFSSTLSVLLGLLIAIHSGYWLYAPFRAAFSGAAFCNRHPVFGALIPYISAIVVGVLLFILFRFVFRRFFKLLVEQPMDQILGAIAGAIKALLVLLIIFSGVSLLPGNFSVRKAFCQDSRMGRHVVPLVQTVLARGAPRI